MNSCKRVPGSQHGLRWTRGLFLCLFGFMTIYWIHCPRGSSLIENMRWNMLWKMPAPVLANVAGKYFWVVRNYIDKRPNHKDVVMYIVMFQLQELHAIYEVSCTMFLYALSSWSSSVVTAIVFRISEMAWNEHAKKTQFISADDWRLRQLTWTILSECLSTQRLHWFAGH